MKSTLFSLVVGTALGLGAVQAMYDAQEEDKTTLPQTKVLQQNISRKETSTSTSFKGNISFEYFPDELFEYICSFFDVSDLGKTAQISTHWKTRIEDPGLWRYMGSKYYGDFLNEEDLKENPKQKVVYHYLSVLVNMAGNLNKIKGLASRYQLDLYMPSFKQYIDLNFLTYLIKDYSNYEELIIQEGNKEAIKRKIERLSPITPLCVWGVM